MAIQIRAAKIAHSMMAILSLKCAGPTKNFKTKYVMVMKIAKNATSQSSSRPAEDDCRTPTVYEGSDRYSVKLKS